MLILLSDSLVGSEEIARLAGASCLFGYKKQMANDRRDSFAFRNAEGSRIRDLEHQIKAGDQHNEHESLLSYTDRLKRYKQENENLRQMLCVSSFDVKPKVDIKLSKKLISMPISVMKNLDNSKGHTTRNKW